MNRSLASLVAGLIVSFAVLGCGGPEREIRARLSPAEVDLFNRGQRLSTPCWNCHDLYGEQNKVGPYLAGLYRRKAGSANFPGYSEAMKRSEVVWDERSLRAFLLNASSFIPGTTMVASGPRSSADVGALVFYLKHVTQAVGSAADSR
ncbi:MAG: c-type cytochrome [Deltaproteobacteria bacterium]|nr:c-type cytochrome [Deltaproteobacteria bacterium]MBW2724409.1 c-type cytochrome [Deltaproteobacteria bacterium]